MVKYYTQQIIHKDIISLSINGEILERVDDNCWCDKEGNLEVMDSIEDIAKKKDYSGRVNLLENQLDSDNEFILGIYFYRYMGSGKAGQIWLGKMTTQPPKNPKMFQCGTVLIVNTFMNFGELRIK